MDAKGDGLMLSILTMGSARNVRAEQDRVIEWNRSHPDGSHVIWTADAGKTQTRTRGLALIINDRAYVYLLGVQGAKPLSQIAACYCRWVRLNRRGRTNHWVHGAWESAEAMHADIALQIKKDRSIESHEISNLKPSECA
jgi:nicotinamidase-related amidase